MLLRVHLPSVHHDESSDWDASSRARLQETMRRAVQRAASSTGSTCTIELVRDEDYAGSELPGPYDQTEARERLDPDRIARGGRGYSIPSFDGGGAPTVVNFDEGVEVTGGIRSRQLNLDGDVVHRDDFTKSTVMRYQGNNYVQVRGMYVMAGNLARAIQWGHNLFSATGYAILQPLRNSMYGPYVVVGLTEPFSIKDLGGLDDAGRTQTPSRMVWPNGYAPVTVVTKEGTFLFATRGGVWERNDFHAVLRKTPPARATVEPSSSEVAAAFISAGAQDDDALLALIVKWDRDMFAAIPWETRAQYLRLLAAEDTEEANHGVLELLMGTRTLSELDALFGILRSEGAYEKLFQNLNTNVIALLRYLAEFNPGSKFTPSYVIDLICDTLQADSVLKEGETALLGMVSWLKSMIEGIIMLVSKPQLVVEGLFHLAEFLWVLTKARSGDAQAQQFVFQMLRDGGAAAMEAMRGLELAETLGTSYSERGKGIATSVGTAILKLLMWFLIAEILSWFVGIGEIKAIGGTITTRIARIAEFLKTISFIARGLEAGAETARFERLMMSIARAASITEEAQLLRVMRLLPDERIEAARRLARATSQLPEEALGSVEAMRAAAAAHPDLLRAVQDIEDAVAVAGRLQARAGAAGELSADAAAGLRILLGRSELNRAGLIEIIDAIPAANIDQFMGTMRFVRPEEFASWGVKGLKDFAERPRFLGLMREVGSGGVVALQRYVSDWREFEALVEGLEAWRASGQPPKTTMEYRQFLERLMGGERAAFEEAADARLANRLNQAGAAGRSDLGMARLQERNARNLIEALSDEPAAMRQQLARELADLPDRQLDALNHIAGLDRPDWHDVLEVVRQWSPTDRAEFLGLVADVAPHTTAGMDKVLSGIFELGGGKKFVPGSILTQPQGSIGQLYAGRTLIRRGARNLEFELRGSGALRRDVDIVCDIGGDMRVEVKTNLGVNADASFARDQVVKDLVNHAPDGYKRMLYMYHPDVAGDLPSIRRRMQGLLTAPDVQAMFTSRGLNIVKARTDLAARLVDAVITYGL